MDLSEFLKDGLADQKVPKSSVLNVYRPDNAM
jgi:hypothetical protein